MSATSSASGPAKVSTGRMKRLMPMPEANHTTISESRQQRDSVSSSAMNTAADSTTGR